MPCTPIKATSFYWVKAPNNRPRVTIDFWYNHVQLLKLYSSIEIIN